MIWGTPFGNKDSNTERKTWPQEGPWDLSFSGLNHPWTRLPLSSPAVASSPQKVQPPAQGSLVLACVSSSLNDLPDEDPLVSLSLISGDGEQGWDEEWESGRVFSYT